MFGTKLVSIPILSLSDLRCHLVKREKGRVMDRVKRDRMIEKLDSLKNLKEWKAYIQNLIRFNDNAVKSALVLLLSLQEEDEQRDNKSIHENGAGFNKIDADFLSRMAKQVNAGIDLTDDEMQACRWALMKYWRQLTDRSKENLAKLKKQRELDRLCEPEQLKLFEME
nr:MAG TPA: hypothetical protein [Caudoviricetes sp.]